jgi:mannose-6-phosphate isomerase-like protein (cupin superfamily)
MNNQEIIIRGKEIKKFRLRFPKVGPWGNVLFANNQKTAMVSQVVTPKEVGPKAEMHEQYTDIFVILEGREEIFIGGRITDKKSSSRGEWLGSKLVGARKYIVGAGDMVIIPKGLAHRHGAGLIKLLVFKIA